MALIDFIKWDAYPGVLAWKYPSQELSTASQLIVSESQEAYLIKEGKFVGPFGAGRHVLSTGNYPGLTTIFGLPFGGHSPFTAEVWFIQKAFSLDIRWGTLDPIQVEDPTYHIMLPIRAFGQYGIQVEDSGLFLSKLVGTMPAFTVKTLTEHFKGTLVSVVKTAIAKCVVEQRISVLKISTEIERLSEAVQESLERKLRTYGVRVCNFCINSISTDEHDPAVSRLRRALAERAEMDIMGFNYQQKRTYDVMERAASNEGAGGMQANMMGAGMGAAMGVGMGQAMAPAVGAMGSQVAPQPLVCPSCNTPNKPESRFCSACGTKLQAAAPAPAAFCPSCGTPNKANSAFCSNCGVSLKA